MQKRLLVFLIFFFLCSAVVVFFYLQKNKHPSSEIIENDEVPKKDKDEKEITENEEVIKENDYFFAKSSGQITINVLLLLVTGILFFLWENASSYNPETQLKISENKISCDFIESIFTSNANTIGLIRKKNWFGLLSLIRFFVTTILVEIIINHLLIGSISHLFKKDKSKKYFSTLKKSWKKRIQFFFSLSKIKILVILGYFVFGFLIAIVVRIKSRIFFVESNTIKVPTTEEAEKELEAKKEKEEFEKLTKDFEEVKEKYNQNKEAFNKFVN